MLVVEIDVVGAEPPQADLASLPDPPGQRTGLVGVVLRPGQELGGDHGLVPTAPEGLADKLLRLPAAVHLGGVEVGDPGVERRPDDADRRLPVELHPEVVAAQPHGGDREALRTQRATLHAREHTARTVGGWCE